MFDAPCCKNACRFCTIPNLKHVQNIPRASSENLQKPVAMFDCLLEGMYYVCVLCGVTLYVFRIQFNQFPGFFIVERKLYAHMFLVFSEETCLVGEIKPWKGSLQNV